MIFDESISKNRAVLVALRARSLSPEENSTVDSVEELAALLETAGGENVGVVLQSKDSPDPRTFIGEGKTAEVKELVQEMDAQMVIFDNALSPSQQRALTQDLGVSVLDRAAPQGEPLLRQVMELPRKDQAVLYLHYYEGFSTREVGEMLRISQSAVTTRLLRARKKLKEVLGEDCPYEA